MKKTKSIAIQIKYLETEESRKWMLKNVQKQGHSRFIREAVAAKIALEKASKK